MQYIVNSEEMRTYDKNTIDVFKVPSLLLMERAALLIVDEIDSEFAAKSGGWDKPSVLIVAGTGNNGGDGFAVGRLLMLKDYKVSFVLLGDKKKCTKELKSQIEIVEAYGANIYDHIPGTNYDIIVDAIFGIGLKREVSGIYKESIDFINKYKSEKKRTIVLSIDIPSGISADDGSILGCAVKADETITFNFKKLGHCIYPGSTFCGKILCEDIGIDYHSFLIKKPRWFTYDAVSDIFLPIRKPDGNKGTFGKVMIIAGNDKICGAAMISALSVFRMGAGMVRIVTSVNNKETLQRSIPEALLDVYDKDLYFENPDSIRTKSFLKEFDQCLNWADCILMGPGIGTDEFAVSMLRNVLKNSVKPLVLDADALNIISENDEIRELFRTQKLSRRDIIVTPHMAEFARLYNCSTTEAALNKLTYPQKFADEYGCVVVCKDARTIVSDSFSDVSYINTSGNCGMATAGSGDVLAGIITGFVAQGMKMFDAAVTGVYLHGYAGDLAAEKFGERGMMAKDITDEITSIIK